MDKSQPSQRSIPSTSNTGSRDQFGRVKNPPMLEIVRMAYRGVRNRLGRMVVTWLGIVLGITFLMSAMVSSGIRLAVQETSDRRAAVESMYGVLRAEVGKLDDKKIVIIRPDEESSAATLEGLLAWLKENAEQMQIVGPVKSSKATMDMTLYENASAIVAWVPEKWSLTPSWQDMTKSMQQAVVLRYTPDPDGPFISDDAIRSTEILPKVTEDQKKKAGEQARKQKLRTQWLIGISLLVAAIGITNALLMSVTERYREISTLKCLGALNSFIIYLMFIESAVLGLSGALAGTAGGIVFSLVGWISSYDMNMVIGSIHGPELLKQCAICSVVGLVVSLIAAIYPTRIAVAMIPADAMRTEI